jgi:predicted ATPase
MKRQNLKSQPFLVEVGLNPAKIPSREEYPFNLPAVRHVESVRFHPSVKFFVGENGTGKSTLGFNPEGGSRNFRFAMRVNHSSLHGAMRLSRSARRQRDGYFFRAIRRGELCSSDSLPEDRSNRKKVPGVARLNLKRLSE